MRSDPFNISFLDINKVIKEENLKEVTSEFIRESSTNRFHPDGLFSEEIFGEVASQRRLETCGYIKLNCRVFHPIIFQNLQSIKRFYVEIMSGSSYAVWDPDSGDFVRASETERGASTGFSFFLKYFDSIDLQKNASLKRNDKIDVIAKFKNTRIIDKIIVIPAGVRDLKEDQGRMEKDSINTIYSSLLRNAKSMTRGADTNPLFDSVHYTIQKRVVEIYEKVAEIIRGKRGFLEGRYSRRSIARGTRNVITASDMDAPDPDSPQYHKIDETKVPLFQAAKAGANQIIYWYKTLFYDQVINMSSENVPLINKKTLHLEYVPIDLKDKDRMLTAEGIERTIDRFRDPFFRFKPVTVNTNNSDYYLFMVYDRGDRIHIVRNVEEFKSQYTQAGNAWDDKLLRPITHCEMLYIAAYFAYKGTHATVTRYPVESEQSIFVSKTHIVTTSPARIIRFMTGVEDNPVDQILPEYPIFGKSFIDVLMLHPTRLKSLKADFDGNCLVGETTIDIRYPKKWMTTCKRLINKYKNTTDQNLEEVLKTIVDNTYKVERRYCYAEIRLQDVPQIGEHTVDKNGANVWDLPDGLEVMSYHNGSATYSSVTKVTVEEDCPVVKVKCGGKSAIVSKNQSLAVFDHESGSLVKCDPSSVEGKLTPYIKGSVIFDDVLPAGTFEDGYSIVSMIDRLSDIDHLSIRCMPKKMRAGYFTAIIDKFGRVGKDQLNTGFVLEFDGINKSDIDYLEKMFYSLGITYFSVLSNEKGMIVLNDSDIREYARDIKFYNKINQKYYMTWLNGHRRPVEDLIPITENEKQFILNESFLKMSSPTSIQKVSIDLRLDRTVCKKCIDPKCDESTNRLITRIHADNVRWGRTIVTDLHEKRRVYDLIVPDTKVFAVNNGLIVFDTCSWIPIFSEEANKECESYLHTPGNYILPSGELLASMCDDLVKLSFFALSRDTPELKK